MKEVITWVDYMVLSDKELAEKLNKTSRLALMLLQVEESHRCQSNYYQNKHENNTNIG